MAFVVAQLFHFLPFWVRISLSQKIRRADERIERESPSQASIDVILKRLDRYAVDRQF
jgi:hypothetical protein